MVSFAKDTYVPIMHSERSHICANPHDQSWRKWWSLSLHLSRFLKGLFDHRQPHWVMKWTSGLPKETDKKKQKNNALLCRISCLDEILFTLLSERISCTSNPTLYSLFSEAVLLFSEVSASVYISQGSEISRWCLCRRLANDLELAGLGLKGTETESSTLEVWLIVTIC